MVSIQSHAANLVFRLMPHDKPGQEHDYAAERIRNDRKPPRAPKGVKVTVIEEDGFSGEWVRKAGNDKGVILYIHGGGFTVGSARERRSICQYIADKHGYDCITFNYRLAPENKWPAQIEDCLAAYKYITGKSVKRDNLVFMGESAGGSLVLSLALWLKDLGMKQPKAIVSFSPCVNQAEHYPSHTLNIKTDHMMRDSVLNGIHEPAFGKDASPEVLKDPLASPIYGDFTGLPPVFISASDTEVLLDDSRELFKKLKSEGHKTGLDIQHGCCHAFQVFTFMPEARAALKNAFDFIETC